MRTAPPDRVVVVGGGAAGLTVIEVLREEDFAGRITLIGAEAHLPYDRPPLSKQVLDGSHDPSSVWLRPPDAFAALDVDLALADPAVGLDRKRQEVVTTSGRVVPYDALVIATGVRPRTLGQSDPAGRAHYLRTLDDALALRQRLLQRVRVVVVGAGFLGVEVAVTASRMGCEVTVVDPEPVPMRRQFGSYVGEHLRVRHERAGIRFRLGVGVVMIEGRSGERSTVHLDDGTAIDADLVVGAVGSLPAHEWLDHAGLAHAVGVPIDRHCRAEARIYVAGDVAAQVDPSSPLGHRRVEHRLNASEQGRCVAMNLLGATMEMSSCQYFWSDQGELRLQAVGRFPAEGSVAVVAGDPEADRFVAVSTVHDVLVGVLAWNDPRGLATWRKRIGAASQDVLQVSR